MKKIKNLFRLLSLVAVLSMTYACSEDETMRDLEKTVDKYELDTQATDKDKVKPPGS